MKTEMIERRISRSLRVRCGVVAAIGCMAVVLSTVQSPVAYGLGGGVPAPGWTYSDLTTFNGGNAGGSPYGSLIISGTTLYGTTSVGGSSGDGVVFSEPVTGGPDTILYSFSGGADGATPKGNLTLVGTTLYGMTYAGGTASDGTIFSVPVTGGPDTVLVSFSGTGGSSLGSNPYYGGLTLVGSSLYGMTYSGGSGGGTGAIGSGTIFSYSLTGGGFQSLYSFTNSASDGRAPEGTLVASGSTLYGQDNAAVIFSISTTGGFTNLGSTGGGNTTGGLILSGTTLYGMTRTAGTGGKGTIFSEPVTGGTPTTLYTFSSSETDGSNPYGDLTLVGTTLYGMSSRGATGGNPYGNVFSVGIDGSNFQDLFYFTNAGTNGYNPYGNLTVSGSTMYGMTWGGGPSGWGALFSMSSTALVVPAVGTQAATATATLDNTASSRSTFGTGALSASAAVAAGGTYAAL